MTRRLLARALRRALPRTVTALAILTTASALHTMSAHASVSAAAWDLAQQRQVVAAGLMSPDGASFNGAGTLTAGQANAAMAALDTRLAASAPPPSEAPEAATHVTRASAALAAHTSQSPVTSATFDRMIVGELGLSDVAAHVQEKVVAAGLHPPAYFGSEVVVRLLELRFEHPVGSQRLDLFPTDPVTRADAAWTLARTLRLSTWSAGYAREQLASFELPQLSAAERQALQIAVARVGYPYIWGGTTDNTADGLEHGGFDCSGFAWRVFKVSGLSWGQKIQGRTAAEQSGEIPRSQRLRAAQLKPGDLLFFGSAHFNSRPTEANVIHEGIYLGENWVIHSSGQGVYLDPLEGGWLGDQFAWGRRVIG